MVERRSGKITRLCDAEPITLRIRNPKFHKNGSEKTTKTKGKKRRSSVDSDSDYQAKHHRRGDDSDSDNGGLISITTTTNSSSEIPYLLSPSEDSNLGSELDYQLNSPISETENFENLFGSYCELFPSLVY